MRDRYAQLSLSIFILFATFLFMPRSTFAELENTTYLVLNHKSLECGGYTPMDSEFEYVLPVYWKYYEIRDETLGNIAVVTEFDDCKYSEVESNETLIKSCCKQLNYKYKSEQIGYVPFTQKIRLFIQKLIDNLT